MTIELFIPLFIAFWAVIIIVLLLGRFINRIKKERYDRF